MTDGPTLPRGLRSGDGAWAARPVAAGTVRVLASLLPVLGGVLSGLLVGLALPPARGVVGVIGWLALVAGACTAGALLTERQARRLFPLAALLQMSLALPDRTPSRLALARRLGGGNTLAQHLADARAAGDTGARWDAAETVVLLVHSLGLHDRRSRGHSERVRALTDLLTAQLGLPAGDRERMRWAALVHDVGKLAVAAPVLQKAEPLTDPEWASLAAHPQAGADLAAGLRPWLGEWAPTIEEHHERWDGAGYPAGLAGTRISYGARLLAVVDTYEVMTAGRPYRPAVSAAEARRELTLCAGEQFDPDVVRAFLAVSLGRLRWATGPWAWAATVPLLARAGRLPLAPTAVSSAAVGAATVLAVALGAIAPAPVPPPAVVLAAPQREAAVSSPDPAPPQAPAAPTATTAPAAPPVAVVALAATSATSVTADAAVPPPAAPAAEPVEAPPVPSVVVPAVVAAAPVRPVAAPVAPPAPTAALPARLFLGPDGDLTPSPAAGSDQHGDHDDDHDGDDGRTLRRSKDGLDTDDPRKLAQWSWTAPTTVRQSARLVVDVGTLVDYRKPRDAALTAFLQRCGGGSCTVLATSTTRATRWPARGDDDDQAPTAPVMRVDLGTVGLDLAAGERLVLSLVADYESSEKDLRLYYGTSRSPSALVVG